MTALPLLDPPATAGRAADAGRLAEKTSVMLPNDLPEGDRVIFGSAGAYTSAFSTVGFTGFRPLPTVLR